MALQRKITYWMLVLLTINSIIGEGIFSTPSITTRIAGYGSIYSWFIGAIISILIALCFAELAAVYESAGGIYEYVRRSFGEFAGFLVGWTAWIVANIAIAMLMLSGLNYLSMFFPLGALAKLGIALAFILGLSYVSFKGIDISIKFLIGFSIITVIAILGALAAGIISFNAAGLANFVAIVPATSIFVAVFFVMETFFGWESVTFMSEEAKEPKKNIPKALLLGTVIVSVVSILIVFFMLTSIPISKAASSQSAVLEIAMAALDPKIFLVLFVLALVNIFGSIAMVVIATPRLVYAMARNKMLPDTFATLHPKNNTPYNAILLQVVITCFVVLSNSYLFLLKILLPLAIIMYSITILSVTKINEKVHRKIRYRVPFHKITPYVIVGLLFAALVMSASFNDILLGVVFVLLGIPLYIIASLGYNEALTKIVHGTTAWLVYRTYKSVISKNIIDHLLNFLSDVTIDRIVDLGCGVGVVTNKIAKSVITPSGKVYGIDYCKPEIEIAKSIAKRQNIKNVEFHQEDFYKLSKNKELSKKLRNLDAFVGIGVLGYIDRLEVILKEMYKRTRTGAKFYFVDYDYPGHLLDRPFIENDKEIIKTFAKAGFAAKVWRQKKPLITFVHIYGEKA